MAVKIGSTISSLQAQRRLGEATSVLSKTYERLSSGQRINRASDDAAGLAISKTLAAQATIYSQGIRNLNDGLSYTGITGDAVKELKLILLRQRELATQSSNGTYSDEQRGALETELRELSSEWNRILESTTFNGRNVFSAKETDLTLQAGVGPNAVLGAAFGSNEADKQYEMKRASETSDGTEGNGSSDTEYCALSGDGRFLVFLSSASNLVAGDLNGREDVFVKDFQNGEVTRVSTDSNGFEGNGDCYVPSISADGRFIAFVGEASLAEGATNGSLNVYLKDRTTGETQFIAAGWGGVQDSPTISADGRYVAFSSTADNLVEGDNNGWDDVFVKDTVTGTIERVSTSSSEGEGNFWSLEGNISADGRHVLFRSRAGNLVAGDTYGGADLFMKDLQTGETSLLSRSSTGVQANGYSASPKMSPDGRYIVFESDATNLTSSGDTNGATLDIFWRDLWTGETKLISTNSLEQQGGDHSMDPSVSADGRYVAFMSGASLVDEDTNGQWDIYVKDIQTGETRLVSDGQAGDASYSPAITADGRYIAFTSWASNLVAGDHNGLGDTFMIGNPLLDWSSVSRNQWLSVATQAEARLSQSRIDAYLEELNGVEGALGAIEARLGTAISNLHSMTENFRAAESRIVDADLGQEAADLTRTQIVQHAASAILAQANQQPQLVLMLLEA